MKIITRSRPWTFLLLIPLAIVIDAALLALALWIDLSIYSPPPNHAGFPIPAFFMIGLVFLVPATALVAIVSACLTGYYTVKNRRLREQEESA